MLFFPTLARIKKKRKDYAFWSQFHEKSSIIGGCPGSTLSMLHLVLGSLLFPVVH